MSLSRKHYTAIAAILKAQRDVLQGEDLGRPLVQGTCDSIARELAVLFKLDNPSFDRGRFLRACGVTEENEA